MLSNKTQFFLNDRLVAVAWNLPVMAAGTEAVDALISDAASESGSSVSDFSESEEALELATSLLKALEEVEDEDVELGAGSKRKLVSGSLTGRSETLPFQVCFETGCIGLFLWQVVYSYGSPCGASCSGYGFVCLMRISNVVLGTSSCFKATSPASTHTSTSSIWCCPDANRG